MLIIGNTLQNQKKTKIILESAIFSPLMNTPHLKFQMSAQHVAAGFVFYVLVLILKNLVYIVYPFGAGNLHF
jgi:hypothetical protein